MLQGDFHGTLGVSRDDRATAIRSAYRDLSRRCESATRFEPPFAHDVARAFEVLYDRRRRAQYEGQPRTPPPAFTDVARLDLFSDFEGGRPSHDEVWSALRSNFAAAQAPKSGRTIVLELTLRVAAAAADALHLAVPVFHPCPACHAAGSVDLYSCTICDGTGLAETRAVVEIALRPSTSLVPVEPLGIRTPLIHLTVERPS